MHSTSLDHSGTSGCGAAVEVGVGCHQAPAVPDVADGVATPVTRDENCDGFEIIVFLFVCRLVGWSAVLGSVCWVN